MDGSVLEKKSSSKMLGLTFFLNWIVALTFSQLLKLSPKKIEALISYMKFLSPEVAVVSL